jgi:hypothetical protein
VIPEEPLSESLSLPRKAALVSEILVSYARIRWRLGRADFVDVISDVRAQRTIRPAEVAPGSLEALRIGARLATAVNRTLRLLPTDSRCLVQSLVLSGLLSSRAISSALVIGAHSKPDFAAHAWVEHCGRPLLPAGDFNESRVLEL